MAGVRTQILARETTAASFQTVSQGEFSETQVPLPPDCPGRIAFRLGENRSELRYVYILSGEGRIRTSGAGKKG